MPNRRSSGANTFALAYGAKSVTATRSELGLRTDKSFAMHECDPDAARPRRLGARLQSGPRHRRDLPDPARRELRRQRRAQAQRRRAGHHGLGRNEMAERLVSLAATFEGEFSNVTRSYAGKGVARYNW